MFTLNLGRNFYGKIIFNRFGHKIRNTFEVYFVVFFSVFLYLFYTYIENHENKFTLVMLWWII